MKLNGSARKVEWEREVVEESSCVVRRFEKIEMGSCVCFRNVLGAKVGRLLSLAVCLDKMHKTSLDGLSAKPVTTFDVSCSSGCVL